MLASALVHRYANVIAAADVNVGVQALLVEEVVAVVVLSIDSIEHSLEVAHAAHLAVPTPLLIATHHEDLPAAAGFAVARAGALALLRDPEAADVLSILDADSKGPDQFTEPSIVPWVAPYVGKVGLFDFEQLVRKALVLQAIARTGSRVQAARLLRAPRAVIQRAAQK
jgi:hypothetical protein